MASRGLHAAIILSGTLLLAGCDKPAPSPVSPTPGIAPVAASKPEPVMNPVTPAPSDIKLRLDSPEPLMPLKGTVKAYEIRDASQLMPGQLADGFLGDLVLENDVVRAVIKRAGPSEPPLVSGGSLIDLANQKSRVDYLNFLQALPDIDSTTTRIVYESVASFLVDRQTTARLVLKGSVVEEQPGDDSHGIQNRIGVSVTTTYELPKDEHRMVLHTRFQNDTSVPVVLAPGDYIDWGQARTFVEGLGVTGSFNEPVNWIAGTMDDFSAGVFVPGAKALISVNSDRYSIIRAHGSGKSGGGAPQALVPESAARSASPAQKPEPMETPPPMFPSALPAPQSPSPVPAPPTETAYDPAVLPSVVPSQPGSELAPPGSAESRGIPDPDESPGGGQKQLHPEGDVNALDPDRLVLQPGEAFEYERHVVVSDRDLARIAREAYTQKGIETGVIGGAVLEEGTNQPVAGAEVRFSGGPNWEGQTTPRAFTRAITRSDGTYSARVPHGTYHISSFKVGRPVAIGSPSVVRLAPGTPPQIVAIALPRQATLRIAVSDPDAPTSAGLPSKLTLIAKPGTPQVDWGFGPDIASGVRNVFFMPLGGAVVPVTPGNYRIVISRGIEYDAIEQDIVVTPGSTQDVRVTLPHPVRTTGMISMDAGVLTRASSVSTVSPRDMIAMAACEGVSILVSGDFDRATDLSGEIASLGLTNWVKAFAGMRFLVAGGDIAANILVYPVSDQIASKLGEFRKRVGDVPPDVFLADLRKEFPELVIQIDQPLHPQSGYLSRFPFNEAFKKFEDGNIPPPDFNAIQLLNGKYVAGFPDASDRFNDLIIRRTRSAEPAPSITPLGGSMCRLPFGTEVGYPRVYLYTVRDTLDRIEAGDVSEAVRGQHVMVTNGPILHYSVFTPSTKSFSARPGDVVDFGTTGSLPMKINVQAASWVSMSGFDIVWNGQASRKIQVMPVQKTVRYPVRQGADADIQNLHIDGDGILFCMAYSGRRPLSPIVPAAPEDFGGEVQPLCWTGPVFVDQNRDGKVIVKP